MDTIDPTNELLLTLNKANCLKDTVQWFYNQVNNVCDGSVSYYPWSLGQYVGGFFILMLIIAAILVVSFLVALNSPPKRKPSKV